jgi:glycine hydroxymethyltransferase
VEITKNYCRYGIVFTGLQLSKEVTRVSGPKLVDFKRVLKDGTFLKKVTQLREEVEAFSQMFPLPGCPDY